ncbi:MAG: M50 family metallopeptidase, partial [Solirubrobacterales bacterium]
MPTRGALTLFHVRGIRIGVDYSWFFVLFLIIIGMSGFYADVLGVPSNSAQPYLLAVISALTFFGSILLHELGHAFVAVRRGIGISDITLWMFGGVATMSRDSDSPGTEFKIAIAGPLVTLAIAIVFIAIGTAAAGWSELSNVIRFQVPASRSGLIAMVAWLASINLY